MQIKSKVISKSSVSPDLLKSMINKIDNEIPEQFTPKEQALFTNIRDNLPYVLDGISWSDKLSKEDLETLHNCLSSIHDGGGNFYEDMGLIPTVIDIYERYGKIQELVSPSAKMSPVRTRGWGDLFYFIKQRVSKVSDKQIEHLTDYVYNFMVYDRRSKEDALNIVFDHDESFSFLKVSSDYLRVTT